MNAAKPTYVVEADKLQKQPSKRALGVSRVVSLARQKRFCGGIQADGPGTALVLCATVPGFSGLHGCLWPDRPVADHQFASARFLHVRHHRLELFLELPQPGRCHLSRQRRPVPQNLFPATDRSAEPDHDEPAQFCRSVSGAPGGDRVL